MPDLPLTDIAHPETWFGFRPGMTRAEVMEKAKDLAVEFVSDEDETGAVTVNEQELEFWFATDGAQRVRQIAMAESIAWAGKPLTDARVDDALRAMEPLPDAVWEANDAMGYPFPPADPTPSLPSTDEQLLEEGTIWLPDRGIGLVISQARVMGAVWRGSQDLPTQFAGPVTDTQRQISRRTDVEEYLWEKRRARNRVKIATSPLGWLRRAWTLVIIVVLALVARTGFQDTRRWAAAPVLTGRLVGMERGQAKHFLEYLPPSVTRYVPQRILTGALFGKRPETDIYRVEFVDPSGRRQAARLESAEFYVPPREAGEETQVIYLSGDPPRVKGPSRRGLRGRATPRFWITRRGRSAWAAST